MTRAADNKQLQLDINVSFAQTTKWQKLVRPP